MASIQSIKIWASGNPIPAYLATPEEDKPHPGLMVFSEIFGINQNIKNVCMRLAEQGYVAISIDHFHREEESTSPFDHPEIGLEKRSRLKDSEIIVEIRSAVDYLKTLKIVKSDCIGSLGFCLGGRLSYLAACTIAELSACVVFYGGGIVCDNPTENMPIAPVAMTEKIQCSVLAHYAEKDHTVPQGHLETIRQSLTNHDKDHEIIQYPRTLHGFANDSKPDSYNSEAAKLAWERTFAFLEKHLKDKDS
jgi:carboxymethylenebutenolidase